MIKRFEFPVIRQKSIKLIEHIREALESSESEEVRQVAERMESGEKAGSLTLAFCGQYNAGKSTLIKALTGREDILISSNVCTDKVTSYEWQGVELLDTPGIQAGYEEHDAVTYEAIDRADLLVFVVTRQLFDPRIAKHFQELAFQRQKAAEMLLVVNKMSLSPGSAETLRPNIEDVISPLKCEDLKTTFVDAKTWLEGSEFSDPDERAELEAYSGFPQFIEALNAFVSEKGLAGRLTTPIYFAKYCAEQGLALLKVEDPGGKEYLEILRRIRGVLVASKERLSRKVRGQIVRAKDEIAREGATVASAIYSGEDEKDLEKTNENAEQQCRGIQEKLKEEIEQSIGEELDRLSDDIHRLSNDPFVQAVIERYGQPSVNPIEGQGPGAQSQAEVKPWSKVGKLLQQLGTWLHAPAIGAKGVDQIFLTASGAAGSNLAKWSYATGKFFGVKFKPWGAANTAKILGNIGKVLTVVGAALAVLLQVIDEIQKAKRQKELQKARSSVLHGYATLASEIQTAFQKQVDSFLAAYYDEAIKRLDDDQSKLTDNTTLRSELATILETLIGQADGLIKEIHGDSAIGAVRA